MRDVNERNRLLYNLAQHLEAVRKRIAGDLQSETMNIDSLEVDEEEKKGLLIELQGSFQDKMKIIAEQEEFINTETGRIYLTVDEVLAQVFDKLYQEMAVFRQQLSTDLGTIANELKDIKKKLIKK